MRRDGRGPLISAGAFSNTYHVGGISGQVSGREESPVLAEITGNDAATPPVHTAKRKTRKDTATINTVVDFDPPAEFDQVLNPLESAIPDGTLVELLPIPDFPDWWWAFPVSVATATGVVWIARLTAVDGSGNWKWWLQALNGSTPPVYADSGSESAAYTGIPSTIDGVNYADPAVGIRVVMWESPGRPGYQEFIPIGYADYPNDLTTGPISPPVPGLVSVTDQNMGEGTKSFNSVTVGGGNDGISAFVNPYLTGLLSIWGAAVWNYSEDLGASIPNNYFGVTATPSYRTDTFTPTTVPIVDHFLSFGASNPVDPSVFGSAQIGNGTVPASSPPIPVGLDHPYGGPFIRVGCGVVGTGAGTYQIVMPPDPFTPYGPFVYVGKYVSTPSFSIVGSETGIDVKGGIITGFGSSPSHPASASGTLIQFNIFQDVFGASAPGSIYTSVATGGSGAGSTQITVLAPPGGIGVPAGYTLQLGVDAAGVVTGPFWTRTFTGAVP